LRARENRFFIRCHGLDRKALTYDKARAAKAGQIAPALDIPRRKRDPRPKILMRDKMAGQKKILRALAGETQEVPPIWMMRQAGRYLPEYRATRAQAGDFLSLCYNSELAAEVTLQPIRRYGFDAAILFADILLVPQALGADLWFVTGEGPRLSTITTQGDFDKLKPVSDIHETLNPVYETVRILSRELPSETTLIGFAGAPWTVATYMIAGRGTPDQGPAHALREENNALFEALLDRITEATIDYLLMQIDAGAEVVKIFDSWAGSLKGDDFRKYALEPARKITAALKAKHPEIPVIGFPREAGEGYIGFAKATGVDCVALDNSVSPEWAAANVQVDGCVQGNLASRHMVTGGQELVDETRAIVKAFSNGPHIFNLGHGITPDADPENVQLMIDTVRGG
jgi:uroporphyrinogen decarboxylase